MGQIRRGCATTRLRHPSGVSRRPDLEDDASRRQKFKRCPIGFSRIDIALGPIRQMPGLNRLS